MVKLKGMLIDVIRPVEFRNGEVQEMILCFPSYTKMATFTTIQRKETIFVLDILRLRMFPFKGN